MIHRNHSRPARVARLLPVLAVSVLLSACASPRAYPPPSGDVKAELTALSPYLQASVLTTYDSPHEGDRGGLTPRAWRDVVVNARVRAIDLQFNAFQQALSHQGVGVGIATDWVGKHGHDRYWWRIVQNGSERPDLSWPPRQEDAGFMNSPPVSVMAMFAGTWIPHPDRRPQARRRDGGQTVFR